MANKRAVILKGTPTFNEEGIAGAAVKPGYLVKGVGTILHHATAGGNVQRAVACEREEFGAGIDNTYQGSGTVSAFYASGDVVKVGVLYPGCQATMFLASGYVVAADGVLQSHGDGTLRPTEASQTTLFRAIDAVAAQALVPTAIRVEAL